MNQTNAKLDAEIIERECPTGISMIAEVHDFLGRFVAYPNPHAQVAHALWCVHTHLMARWDSTPRIAFLSPEPGSGKTRALEITELLVHSPVATMNATSAYLFRKVGQDGGATVLFDEIDTVFGPKTKDQNEDIRGLINAGHRRGGVAGRCVMRGKTVETEELPAYAAVAMGGLGWLPDTILTRSVIIRMRRRMNHEVVEPFRARIHTRAGHEVRDRIAAWSAANAEHLSWIDPDKMPASIQDRDADVWEALLMIADVIGGDWPARARAAAVTLVTAAKDAEPSLNIRLLADLRTVFGDESELPSKAILNSLYAVDESPWGDVKAGKPLDERGLAHRLRQYGVKSRTIRIATGTIKGYTRADLWDAWSRYLPQSSSGSVTSVTGVTSEPVADVTRVTQFPGMRSKPDPDSWTYGLDDALPSAPNGRTTR